MDVRIEAAVATATAQTTEAVVFTTVSLNYKAFSLVETVASSSCPSISGHSISAVAPDHNFYDRRLALGGIAA